MVSVFSIDLYATGELKEKVLFLNGKKTGLMVYYTPNGRLIQTTEYFNDKRNGIDCIYND
jgi:antitoxin component YwqK of YwqJK toxin-antitoxin module